MMTDERPNPDGAGERPVTLLTLANVLLRRRRMLLVVPGVAVALAFLATLLQDTRYQARTKLLLQSSGVAARSDIASLAAQFGVIPMQSGGGEGMPFYRELVRTRDVLRTIVLSEYEVAVDSGREHPDTLVGNLVELYRVEGKDEEARIRGAMGILAGSVVMRDDPRSGLIFLETRADWPDLAVQLNRRFLEQIDEYNRNRRKSRASAERRFVEERLNQARAELIAAERELEAFLEQNRRGHEDSPQLLMTRMRLEREVEQRQQVYVAMFQAHEQARIAEVREIPVFTIVEPPDGSEEALRSDPVMVVIVALFMGLFLAIALVLVVEFVARQRALSPEEYAEFRSLWSTTRGELGLDRLARRLRRAPDPAPAPPIEEPLIPEPHSSARDHRL